MVSKLALQKAAQAWCTLETSQITMDPVLAEAFAGLLDEIWSQPWLGNATTRELIDELRTRCELNGTLEYSTVNPVPVLNITES